MTSHALRALELSLKCDCLAKTLCQNRVINRLLRLAQLPSYMSDANLARRIQASAWRSTGALPEDTARGWHDDDMRALGKGRRVVDPDAVLDDAGSLLTRPASLTFIFLITFVVILSALLWREGRFDGMIANLTPKVARPSGGWIESAKSLGDSGSVQTADQTPPPAFENELEKAEQRVRDQMAPPKVVDDAEEE
jgi:hypothetical protein